MTHQPQPRAHAAQPDNAVRCLVCAAGPIEVFFEQASVAVHVNRLWESPEAARQAPVGEMRLGFCQNCGHVFNLAFDPDRVAYDEGYENSLHFSPHFNEYARSTAARLVERYDLHGKDVIEIGSGKGEFLELLCELGDNRGLGFDPSYEPGLVDERGGRIRFVKDFYSERYTHYQADLVCARHVLEHAPQPAEMLAQVRRAMGENHHSTVFFEVPNVLYTLRDLGIWDIIYEHVSYFSPGSLRYLFEQSGFSVYEVTETFGGQFLTLEATPDPQASPRSWEGLDAMSARVQAFAENYRQKVSRWRERLAEMKAQERKVIVWGAGSKGVTFLNRFATESPVEWVVDLNPRKQGRYIPVTGQKIVPPAFLEHIRPEVIVVMNPNYETEIRAQVSGFGIEPEFYLV